MRVYYTLKEFAALVKLSERSVHRLIKDGDRQLPDGWSVDRLGGVYRFSREEPGK